MAELTGVQRLVVRVLLALFLLYLVLALLFHRLRLWFNGHHESERPFSRSISFSQLRLEKLNSECNISHFSISSDHLSGSPLKIHVSSLSLSRCFILKNIPIESFHEILLTDYVSFKNFLEVHAEEELVLRPGIKQFTVDVGNQSYDQNVDNPKRTHYSLILGLVSNISSFDKERIAISCYVVHVRLREEERVATCIMYTFWKTNWGRLLTPQAMYAARDDTADRNESVAPDDRPSSYQWNPSCFICLSVAETGLRVFLPCRHAGLCSECFDSFCQKLFARSADPLSTLLSCPLCRTPISGVLSLPPTSSAPQ